MRNAPAHTKKFEKSGFHSYVKFSSNSSDEIGYSTSDKASKSHTELHVCTLCSEVKPQLNSCTLHVKVFGPFALYIHIPNMDIPKPVLLPKRIIVCSPCSFCSQSLMVGDWLTCMRFMTTLSWQGMPPWTYMYFVQVTKIRIRKQ